MKGDDVWMSKGLENLDFSIEVLLQLFVKTAEFDGLDGYQGTSNLISDKVSKWTRIQERGVKETTTVQCRTGVICVLCVQEGR